MGLLVTNVIKKYINRTNSQNVRNKLAVLSTIEKRSKQKRDAAVEIASTVAADALIFRAAISNMSQLEVK